MFEEYGNKTKVQFKIMTPDDNRKKFHTTDVDIYSTYPITINRRMVFSWTHRPIRNTVDGRIEIHVSLLRGEEQGEPLILSLNSTLQKIIGWGGRGYKKAPKEFKVGIVFPTANIGFWVEKGNVYYELMGHRIKKKNLLTALSRVLYRSCFEDNGQVLLQYLFRMISLPENVSYVLENRTPYWFFLREEAGIQNIRLNTKLISNDECALEISDGIWAPISVTDLDVFVNTYYYNHRRSDKWKSLSPSKLWTELMGYPPKEYQKKLMIEFLIQNRTQDIVESRAKELMNNLTIKYPDRVRIIELDKHTLMLVRGKLCDWVIVDSTYKTNVQKVKTYIFVEEKFNSDEKYIRQSEKNNFEGGSLRGPICIDNIHTTSSVGDQYVARALALLNDKITISLVHTIAKYVPKSIRDDETGNTQSRFKFKELDANAKWGSIL